MGSAPSPPSPQQETKEDSLSTCHKLSLPPSSHPTGATWIPDRQWASYLFQVSHQLRFGGVM